MRPLTLKESTKCCGSPTALWIVGKGYYACPCGETKIDLDGKLIGKRRWNHFKKRERKPRTHV